MGKKDYPEHTGKKEATPLMLHRLPYMLFTRYNRANADRRFHKNDTLSTIFYINFFFYSLPYSD